MKFKARCLTDIAMIRFPDIEVFYCTFATSFDKTPPVKNSLNVENESICEGFEVKN